jgi:acetyltransferase-like isoleucine patch superfamily enzyme
MAAWIHPSARVEDEVEIGDQTRIWDHVHIRGPTRIGRACIIGEKTYIAHTVEIGNRVKINAFVYLCAAVTIETGAMISAGVVFTNDRYPRATTPDLAHLRTSGIDEATRPTRVGAGATVGARAVVGCDLTIGRFATVGMGSVVTRSVPDHVLVLGSPARPAGIVCACGMPLWRGEPDAAEGTTLWCEACAAVFVWRRGVLAPLPARRAS